MIGLLVTDVLHEKKRKLIKGHRDTARLNIELKAILIILYVNQLSFAAKSNCCSGRGSNFIATALSFCN